MSDLFDDLPQDCNGLFGRTTAIAVKYPRSLDTVVDNHLHTDHLLLAWIDRFDFTDLSQSDQTFFRKVSEKVTDALAFRNKGCELHRYDLINYSDGIYSAIETAKKVIASGNGRPFDSVVVVEAALKTPNSSAAKILIEVEAQLPGATEFLNNLIAGVQPTDIKRPFAESFVLV